VRGTVASNAVKQEAERCIPGWLPAALNLPGTKMAFRPLPIQQGSRRLATLRCRDARTPQPSQPPRRGCPRIAQYAGGMQMIFWRIKPLDQILATAEKKSLKRQLGPIQLTLLGIGAVIGTGIFVLTAEAAQKSG